MRLPILVMVIACTFAVSACSRFEEAKPLQVDDHQAAESGASEDKPFGPIFGEGYVE